MIEIYQKLKIYVQLFFVRGRKKDVMTQDNVRARHGTLFFFLHFFECLSASNFLNVISIISKFLELLGAERKF